VRTKAKIRHFPGAPFGVGVGLALGLFLATGCAGRAETEGVLRSPPNAREWTGRLAVAFDDAFTPTGINLAGRAPNDVQDQRLFAARLGHADLVVLVRLEQMWGKGRYAGRQDQYVELSLGEVLAGQLEDGVADEQLVGLVGQDKLSGDLNGQLAILFVRWDPGAEPSFHHHLMAAQPATVVLIKSMVAHADDAGVNPGKRRSSKASRRRNRRRSRARSEPRSAN